MLTLQAMPHVFSRCGMCRMMLQMDLSGVRTHLFHLPSFNGRTCSYAACCASCCDGCCTVDGSVGHPHPYRHLRALRCGQGHTHRQAHGAAPSQVWLLSQSHHQVRHCVELAWWQCGVHVLACVHTPSARHLMLCGCNICRQMHCVTALQLTAWHGLLARHASRALLDHADALTPTWLLPGGLSGTRALASSTVCTTTSRTQRPWLRRWLAACF